MCAVKAALYDAHQTDFGRMEPHSPRTRRRWPAKREPARLPALLPGGGAAARLLRSGVANTGYDGQLIFLKVKPGDSPQKGSGANVKGGKLSMTRRAIALVAASLVVGAISSSAFAVSKRTTAAANRDVRTLVLMMDKDKDGTVSKDEFMQFMSREFDRLDVTKTGKLEPAHLRPIRNPSWPLGDCVRRPFPACSGD
jgi:hypothetical protein